MTLLGTMLQIEEAKANNRSPRIVSLCADLLTGVMVCELWFLCRNQ